MDLFVDYLWWATSRTYLNVAWGSMRSSSSFWNCLFFAMSFQLGLWQKSKWKLFNYFQYFVLKNLYLFQIWLCWTFRYIFLNVFRTSLSSSVCYTGSDKYFSDILLFSYYLYVIIPRVTHSFRKKLLKKIIKKNSVISSKRHNIKVGFVKNYRILMDLGACITVCK